MIVPRLQHPANVLLGVDGSEHCQAAVALLKDLPCVASSRVRMMSVWSGRSQAERARLEAALRQSEAELSGGCAEIATELCQGHPAETLVKAASAMGADLIVVGAKGLRATLGILLGGVAQQVVEHAGCAVLVVRAPYAGLRRALLVTDGSETSTAALDYLAHFSLPQGTRDRVCHVVALLGLTDFSSGAWPVGHDLVPVMSDQEIAELERQHEEDRARGRELVNDSVALLREHGAEVDGVLLEGDAATEILRHAKNSEVDLIAAGSRGLSEVQGWLMGSVSRKLVNFAGCSVLIVKTPKEGGG